MTDSTQGIDDRQAVYKGQLYELARTEPHTRRDGTTTILMVWRSHCPTCGEPFETRTPSRARKFQPGRRCPRHKRPARQCARLAMARLTMLCRPKLRNFALGCAISHPPTPGCAVEDGAPSGASKSDVNVRSRTIQRRGCRGKSTAASRGWGFKCRPGLGVRNRTGVHAQNFLPG